MSTAKQRVWSLITSLQIQLIFQNIASNKIMLETENAFLFVVHLEHIPHRGSSRIVGIFYG